MTKPLVTHGTKTIGLTGSTPIYLGSSASSAGAVVGSAGTVVQCDRRVPINIDGTDYYLAVFDTLCA